MLTEKKRKFALGILEGLEQAEAYRRAYDAKAMKPATIYKRASELIRDGEVAGMLAAQRQQVLEAVGKGATDIARVAWSIAEDPEAPPSARISALSLEARRYPEYSEKRDPAVDARSLHLHLPEGTTLDDLRKLRDELRGDG